MNDFDGNYNADETLPLDEEEVETFEQAFPLECQHGKTVDHYFTIAGARGLWQTYTYAWCHTPR